MRFRNKETAPAPSENDAEVSGEAQEEKNQKRGGKLMGAIKRFFGGDKASVANEKNDKPEGAENQESNNDKSGNATENIESSSDDGRESDDKFVDTTESDQSSSEQEQKITDEQWDWFVNVAFDSEKSKEEKDDEIDENEELFDRASGVVWDILESHDGLEPEDLTKEQWARVLKGETTLQEEFARDITDEQWDWFVDTVFDPIGGVDKEKQQLYDRGLEVLKGILRDNGGLELDDFTKEQWARILKGETSVREELEQETGESYDVVMQRKRDHFIENHLKPQFANLPKHEKLPKQEIISKQENENSTEPLSELEQKIIDGFSRKPDSESVDATESDQSSSEQEPKITSEQWDWFVSVAFDSGKPYDQQDDEIEKNEELYYRAHEKLNELEDNNEGLGIGAYEFKPEQWASILKGETSVPEELATIITDKQWDWFVDVEFAPWLSHDDGENEGGKRFLYNRASAVLEFILKNNEGLEPDDLKKEQWARVLKAFSKSRREAEGENNEQ